MSALDESSSGSGEINSDAQRLKIVMVDSHGSIERGGAVQCASLARALARRGHRVTCIFDGKPNQPLHGVWFQSLQNSGVRVLHLGLQSPAGMLQLRRIMAVERPDILHTHKNRALFCLLRHSGNAPSCLGGKPRHRLSELVNEDETPPATI